MLGLSSFVPRDPVHQLAVTVFVVGILVATVFAYALRPKSKGQQAGTVEAYLKFIYGCFLKPHTGDGSGSQQDALVSKLAENLFQTLKTSRRASTRLKQTFMMPLDYDFYAVARTCSDWLRLSLSIERKLT